MTRTLALTVAYDGTAWAGLQRQTQFPSIQGALEAALTTVLQHPVTVAAAGRTDAGVHALGQVVSLRTESTIPLERVPWVTNRVLPESIRVRAAVEREPWFHARLSARSRRYVYVVQPTRHPDPLRSRFCWQVPPVDVDAMVRAAATLCGRHDFAAFCHGGEAPGSTVRTVQRLAVRPWRGTVVVDIQADAFLRRMIRLLVGVLVQVGCGEQSECWPAEVLAARDRTRAGQGAPPNGLCLMRIGYPPIGDAPPLGVYGGEFTDEEFSGEIAGS
jgi:tRNA pseudouridine38-40 synthase